MRVTFILNCFVRDPSGGFRVVYEYANRLAQQGHQVTVVHEQWYEGWHRPLRHVYKIARDRWHSRKPDGLHEWLHWMHIDPRVRLIIVPKLEPDAVPDGDVVIATYWTTALLLPKLTMRHGVPLHLVQLYEIWGVSDPIKVDDALRLPAAKIAVSQHLSDFLQGLGVPREKIAVVPNGLDHDVYYPPDQDSARGLTVSLLVGSSLQKGTSTAAAVLEQVRQRIPDVQALAFGVGPRPAALPKWVTYSQGLSGPELASRVYRSSAVFLCSSVSEGWGLPPAEAMACGAALVSTRNGGVEDYSVDGQNALLADVGDVSGLAAAIVRLLQDDQLRRRLVSGGLATVAKMSWSTSAEGFRDVLQAAVADNT